MCYIFSENCYEILDYSRAILYVQCRRPSQVIVPSNISKVELFIILNLVNQGLNRIISCVQLSITVMHYHQPQVYFTRKIFFQGLKNFIKNAFLFAGQKVLVDNYNHVECLLKILSVKLFVFTELGGRHWDLNSHGFGFTVQGKVQAQVLSCDKVAKRVL